MMTTILEFKIYNDYFLSFAGSIDICLPRTITFLNLFSTFSASKLAISTNENLS